LDIEVILQEWLAAYYRANTREKFGFPLTLTLSPEGRGNWIGERAGVRGKHRH
jgi:hypothetical protein